MESKQQVLQGDGESSPENTTDNQNESDNGSEGNDVSPKAEHPEHSPALARGGQAKLQENQDGWTLR